MNIRSFKSKLLWVFAAFVMSFVLIGVTTVSASANQNSFLNNLASSMNASISDDLRASAHNTDFANNQSLSANQLANEEFPTTFNLNNFNGKNCVTPVKFQNPWGNCWAFGITAAAESSILSESTQVDANTLDLSERHLAWFAKTHIPSAGEPGYDPATTDNQSGEGKWYKSPELAANRMNNGQPFFGTVSFSSGQGPVWEWNKDASGTLVPFAPYRNDEGSLYAENAQNQSKTFTGENSVEQAISEGYSNYGVFTKNGTWSLNENKRFAQKYKLENSNILPDATPTEKQGGGYELNTAGVKAFKKELSEGHGINIVYAADSGEPYRYLNITNNKYSHFTWTKNANIDHSVEIVGWDDNYSADNFVIKNPVSEDASHNKIYRLKASGEDLKNDAEGDPIDPVTKQKIDKSLCEASCEHGNQKTISAGGKTLNVYKDLGNDGVDYEYNTAGTTLKRNDTELDASKIMFVSLNDDKSAKRDTNNHVIYRKWTPDGLSTDEYTNDAEGNPIVGGQPITDKVVVENSFEDVTYKPSGNGAWIVKNSWGAANNQIPNKYNWGTDGTGFFYLSFYDLCITKAESFDFAVSETEQANAEPYGFYQYDFMPIEALEGSDYDKELFMSNIFTADTDVMVTNVSTNTLRPKTTVEYKIFKLNDNYQNPEDGKLLCAFNKTYDFGGFHRANLDPPIYYKKGDKISIVVDEYYTDDAGNKKYIFMFNKNIGINNVFADKYGYCVGVVNKGESYLGDRPQTQIEWEDLADYIAKIPVYQSGENAYDNFSIKANVSLATSIANPQSEGAAFNEGEAPTDTVFTIGKGVKDFNIDNFDVSKGVEVDGAKLDSKHYKAESGSIVLTIFQDYLNTLSAGQHNVRIFLKDSGSITGLPEYIDTSITVNGKGGPGGGGDTPGSGSDADAFASSQTADCTTVFAILLIFATIAACFNVVLVKRKLNWKLH